MKTFTPALLRASARSWVASDMRRVGPYWLQWVWTALFSAVLALGFTALGYVVFGQRGAMATLDGVLAWYGKNFIVCLTVAAVIHLGFEGLSRLLGGPDAISGWKDWQRSLFFGGVPLVGCALGWPLGVTLAGGHVPSWLQSEGGMRIVLYSMSAALVLTFFFHHWFSAKARQYHAEKRATEAQLKLLQAQIEPHFLFNTLANVEALIEHDGPKARAMLSAFTDYLRASLSGLRRDTGPLADELALAEAYLRVQQTRMDERLRFAIQADDAARRVALPPLLLQPLVENAVHHGLEPQLEGGTVQVRARAEGERLVIEVEDDGRGLAQTSTRKGAGLALANIRQRLAQRFGDGASLELKPAARGTLAVLTLPLHKGALA
jgi:hypothetical protein